MQLSWKSSSVVEVRAAVEADLPAVHVFGGALHSESAYYSQFRYDAQRVDAVLRAALAAHQRDEDACFFVAQQTFPAPRPVGAFIAMLAPYWFSAETYVADLSFYVAPEHRGGRAAMLLRAAVEAWARHKGATSLVLGVSTGINAEYTQRFYEKLGHSPVGRSFVKRLV